MHKNCKKFIVMMTAATMAMSALSLSACDTSFTPLTGDTTGTVSSNGGFVVEKGNWFYFINGIDTYTSDNTYGDVVKASLMRISKTDLAAGKNEAETVIPSLMVASDYTSGIYIYGERVYYATPNNVKNTQGVVENDYLDFKSAKLDGSDVKSYFRVDDNATVYRYVEVNDTVYMMYVSDSTLYSYNTATETTTTLVEGGSYKFNSTDTTDPTVYYTMSVVDGDDKDSPNTLKYNQVYRVSADATAAPYEFTYDQDYLDENDGEAPYHNYGTIVLDGIGKTGIVTQYTHDLTEGVTAIPTIGYTYELLSYTNGGIYFTRSDLAQAGSTTGETGWLYYLSADKLTGSWNSVSGNADSNFDAIAQDTTNASASALFYTDDAGQHYIYVSGSEIRRADVGENGVATETRIARNVSGATLMYLDSTSDETYDYVYYNRSGNTGLTVERAVYNGTEDDYSNLKKNDAYRPVRVFDVEHASDWYQFEIVGGYLFYADTVALGSNSFNYIATVDLKTADGKLMTNAQIKAENEKYEEVTEYISDLSDEQSSLSTAINSYFYTGTTQYFDDNLAEAAEAGEAEDALYSADEQAAFKAYAEGKEGETDLAFKDYRVRSAFILPIGAMSEADTETYDDYWHTTLQKYTATEEEEEGLPVWAWVLIGVGCAIVVAAAVLVPVLVVRSKKRKAEAAPKKEKLAVDTTDDKSVDVYTPEELTEVTEEPAAESEEVQEQSEEAVSEPVEAPVDEVPAEESAEAPTEGNSEE